MWRIVELMITRIPQQRAEHWGKFGAKRCPETVQSQFTGSPQSVYKFRFLREIMAFSAK